MRVQRIRVVVRKEVREFRRNRFVIGTMAVLPFIFLITPMIAIFKVPESASESQVKAAVGVISLLMLIILPFWTSFLLRVYALEGIIRETGLLNTALLWLGVIDHPLQIMRTTFAVYLGIIYSYLPFMVLPLFATLEKLDHSLLEAAGDLGSPPWRAFLEVTLPLSMPGIIAGSMLVFIPAIGEFVIPTLLGGPDNLMIGRVLWDEFFGNRDWPVASAVAIAFLVLLVGPIALYQHYSTKQLNS